VSLRAQSNVVGVALLLGVTVVALGTLTAGVGTVVDQHAAASDARRVATDLDDALQPVETTGVHRGDVAFTDGELDLVERQVRVLNSSGGGVVVDANALRFTAGSREATYLAGSVFVAGNGWGRTRTPLSVAADPGVLVVSVPALRGNVSLAASGGGGVTRTVRSNVSHRRHVLGQAGYRVAVETEYVDAVAAQFEAKGATTTTTRDFDDDGVESVVASFDGARAGYVVVHETEVSVR
jgi:hypothetical protein